MRSTQLTRRLSRLFIITLSIVSCFSLLLSLIFGSQSEVARREGAHLLNVRDLTGRTQLVDDPQPLSGPAAIEGWVEALGGARKVAGARVSLEGRVVAVTDGEGYFGIPREIMGASNKEGKLQVTLNVQGRGYAEWAIRGALYREGDTLRIYPRLSEGAQPTVIEADRAGVGSGGGYKVSLLPNYARGNWPQGSAAFSGTFAPPATIRIYRTRIGTVEVVPFKDYVKRVLPNEWIPSWSPEALKAGAMAVKSYAWYWVSVGGKQGALGADLKDNVEDQVYDPNISYASTDAAVDATFDYAMTRNGSLFQAQYCAGAYDADPTGDCPWPGSYMTQWGSAYHADQGRSWAWILGFYYGGATITPRPPGGGYNGAPPSGPGNPTAVPSRQPQPTPQTGQYVVGQGSNHAEVFEEAYRRNGGEATLGRPVGPVRWWMQYISEVNVLSQRFSGPAGKNDVWVIYNVLDSSSGLERAYVLAGEISAAYAAHQPPGPEWVGAPSSDPYIGTDGRHSQGFSGGTLQHNGQGVVFYPWPTTFEGWEARYYAGYEKPGAPLKDLQGRAALVKDVASPNIEWPGGQGVPQTFGVGKGSWAAQFTKQMRLEGGEHSFTLMANGPALLWLDGVLVINGADWSGMNSGRHSATIAPGEHRLRVHYFNGGGDAKLQLDIRDPSQAKEAPTPIPGILPPGTGARLEAKVQWLGGRGQARGMTLYLSDPQTSARLLAVVGRTDERGVANFSGLPPGRYNVHVKGPHSLQSAIGNVELIEGGVVRLDMGAQVEGDVDGDNCVTVDDFMRVQVMLGAHAGIPGFDPASDLDADGMVTMRDVSLLRSGFDMCGDLPADGGAFAIMSIAGEVALTQHLTPWTNPGDLNRNLTMRLVAPRGTSRVGETIEVRAIAQAGSQVVDGASFVLRYDPKLLVPVDAWGGEAEAVEPGLALPAVMGNWIDRKGGAVGYSAGVLQGSPPQGEFVVATLRFRVLAGGDGPTRVTFAPTQSGHVQITNGGINLLGSVVDLTVNLVP